MATSPMSYLQTLSKEEAVALVASLQKIQEHLSQELEWMSAQVQQKTVQLQGIETLLSEAAVLKLSKPAASLKAKPESTPESTAIESTLPAVLNNAFVSAALTASAETNGNPPALTKSTAAKAASKTSSTKKSGSKTKPGSSKQAKTTKTSTTKAKKTKPTAQTASKAASATTKPAAATEASGLQQFLQQQFQDKSLNEAIGEILERSKTPLGTDDIVNELYSDLSDENYKRAKHSVANMLSMGKNKRKWKSTSRGMYASNALISK